MSPLVPTQSGLTYLTLDDLEAIAHANPGFEIFAAQGPSGPEWHLKVPVAGREVIYRAHRAVAAEVAS